MLLEGPTLVAEALDAGIAIERLFHEEAQFEALAAQAHGRGIPVGAVATGVLGSLLTTVTPQAVVAVAAQPVAGLDSVMAASRRGGGPVVVLAGVSDPGNAGGLLRTAEAAGASGVIFTDTTVDPYSPKVVRASAGSILRLPIVPRGDLGAVLRHLGDAGIVRLSTASGAGRPPDELDLTRPTAIVLGNEAHGLPDDVGEWLDDSISIPMAGGESLNVGVAGAVALFEAARQQRAGQRPVAAQLVSRASHELRSPLTAVKGFSGVLVNRWDRLDDEKKRTMVVDINHESDRLDRMITELLELSRLESGRLRLDPRALPLAELVAASIERVRVDHPDAALHVDVPSDLPPALGDATRIQRIVVNLIENAVKYGQGADVRIEGDCDDHQVRLAVSDAGPGLSADEVDRAFDPIDGPTGGQPSGTGLGLWLGRSIAEAHQGSLVLESTPGAGTRVRLSLPRAETTT